MCAFRSFSCAAILSVGLLISSSAGATISLNANVCESSNVVSTAACTTRADMALVSVDAYYAARSDSGNALGPIDLWGKCRYVDNISEGESAKALFIPFKTSDEWLAFINNAPSSTIHLDRCARPETKTVTPAASVTSESGVITSCKSPNPASFEDSFLTYARIDTIRTKSWTFECTDDSGNKWDQLVTGKFTALDSDAYNTNGMYWKEEYTYTGTGCDSMGGFGGDLVVLLDLSNSISDSQLAMAKDFIKNLAGSLQFATPPSVAGPFPYKGTGRIKVARFASCDTGQQMASTYVIPTPFFTKNSLQSLPAAIGGRIYYGNKPCDYTDIGTPLGMNYVVGDDIGNAKTYLLISDGNQTVYPYGYTSRASSVLAKGTRIIAIDVGNYPASNTDRGNNLPYITSTQFDSKGLNNSYYKMRYNQLTQAVATNLANSTCEPTTILPLAPRTASICSMCDLPGASTSAVGTPCYTCWHSRGFAGE